MHVPTRSWSLAAFGLLLAAAAAPAAESGPAALEAAARRLAALPGLRARVVARDDVGARTFEATIVYRAPDRFVARIPPDDYAVIDGGRVTVREGGKTRSCDVAAWVAATAARLSPTYAEAAALTPGAGPSGAPCFADAAARLSVLFQIDLYRREDRVAIGINLSHDVDFAGSSGRDRGLRFTFLADDRDAATVIALDERRIVLRAGPREATIARDTGLPERVLLRSATGRVEAEVELRDVEVLEKVPEELLGPPGRGTGEVEAVDPTPHTKAQVARGALAAIFERLEAGAAKDPALLTREAAKVEAVLTRYDGAIFEAAYPTAKLREQAREAARRDEATVRQALARAGPAGRAKAIEELRAIFRNNCTYQMREAAVELVQIAEAAIDRRNQAAPETRRALVAASGRAVLAAFQQSIVGPMESEAAAEIEKIAAAPPAASGATRASQDAAQGSQGGHP
jgi:hypothetical protein